MFCQVSVFLRICFDYIHAIFALLLITFRVNENVKFFSSLPLAADYCSGYEKIFIIGGQAIYRQALEFADKIELTLIHKQYEGDTFSPQKRQDAAVTPPTQLLLYTHSTPTQCPSNTDPMPTQHRPNIHFSRY